MINRLLAYSPNLKQSWILVVIILLCGVIVGGVATAITKGIVPEWANLIGSVFGYVVIALIVIRLGKSGSYEPVALPRQSPLLWLLLVLFTLTFGLVTAPLGMWIPMPDMPDPQNQLNGHFPR